MSEDLPEGLGNRFGRLDDLPPELLTQIPAARIGELDQQIINLLQDKFDGAASVDEILVGLYRDTSVIHDRRKLAGKLYRMVNSQPKLLDAVPRKRGVYRLPE